MQEQSKIIIGILVLVIIVLGIFILSDSPGNNNSASTAKGGDTIKIGAILPLTGEGSVYGQPMKKVIKIAVEEINEKGGVNGKNLEVIYEDGKCGGKGAASAMQKLANVDKVEAVIGGFCSGESLAAAPIAKQTKVFLISGGSSSPDLTGINKYFARTYPSDAAQGRVLAEIAYNDKGWKDVEFILEQKKYPQGIYKSFKKRFKELGGEVEARKFQPGSTDFRSILSKIEYENPDAVFVDTQAAPAAQRIFKQIKEFGLDKPLLVSDVVIGSDKTINKYPDLLEGTLGAEVGTSGNEKYKNLISTYKKKYDTDEVPYKNYAQTVYDAVYLTAKGIEKVGYNGEKLAEWVRNTEGFTGASGPISIKENGNPKIGHTPEVVKDGEVVPYRN